MKTKIKEWYMRTYPSDELGSEINEHLTFEDLFPRCHYVYELLGVADSIVRERVFQQLADIMNVDYSVVYNKWLKR